MIQILPVFLEHISSRMKISPSCRSRFAHSLPYSGSLFPLFAQYFHDPICKFTVRYIHNLLCILCSQASVRFFSSPLLTIFLFSHSAENSNWILSFGRKLESEIFVSLSTSGHNHDTCSLDSQIPYCSWYFHDPICKFTVRYIHNLFRTFRSSPLLTIFLFGPGGGAAPRVHAVVG